MAINIRTALQKRNMKQSQLADGLNLSRGYVSELVSGKKTPTTDTLIRIAQFLSVSPTELFETEPSTLESNLPYEFSEAPEAFIVSPKDSAKPDTVTGPQHRGNHIATLQAATTLPALLIQQGDLLTVDMRQKSTYGKLAAVTRVNLETGTGRTLIRRIEQRYIASADPLQPDEKWQSPTHNFAVMGQIIQITRNL